MNASAKSGFLASLAIVLDVSPLSAKAPEMFPPEAIEVNDYYKNWYGPELRSLGQRPLWGPNATLPDEEVIRFTFIPGVSLMKGPKSTAIRISIPKTGNARIIAVRRFLDGRKIWNETQRKGSVTKADADRLRELVQSGELTKFPVGSWENPEEISIHCTELIMERALNGKYNLSHVLISCNQPQKLMPLVDHIVEIAKMKPEQLFYIRMQ